MYKLTHCAALTAGISFTWMLSLCIVCLATPAQPAGAQQDPARNLSFRDQVTDRVTLKDGTRMRGLAVSEKPATLILRTDYLKSNHADLFTDRMAPQLRDQQQSAALATAETLQREIERLQQLHDLASRQRAGLLSEIHERLLTSADADPEFVTVQILRSQLRQLDLQSPQRRQVCRLAMLNHIPDLEHLSGESIVRLLQAIPEPERRTAMPTQPAAAAADHQRIFAAVDVRLNSVSRLIRSGNSVIDESAQPGVTELITSMLTNNLQNLLNELLNETAASTRQQAISNSLPSAAVRIAESHQHPTVILSGFELNPGAGSAAVTRQLFHKTDNGQWTLLLTASGSATVADLRPEQIAAIENDPQVREIASVVGGLGLGDEQFTNALRMGGVVQNALSMAEQIFATEIQNVITTKGLAGHQQIPRITLADQGQQTGQQ